jgi:endonuclease/exonuclease/phosphatase family metal-dependent hydrolase
MDKHVPIAGSQGGAEASANTPWDTVDAVANHGQPHLTLGRGAGHRLRLLSYNIQTGVASSRYSQYLTYGWKHLLPYAHRWENLDRIARAMSAFDLVGLQEVDSGSLRTGFVNQTKYLAEKARFPFWHCHTNRRLGKLAQNSNALLSRLSPHAVIEHRLPGLPGRGAILVRFGAAEEPLVVAILHLALGKRGRTRQIEYLCEQLGRFPHVILMGDLNCNPDSREMRYLLRETRLRSPDSQLNTFPSWRPRRSIDHILATPEIEVERTYIPHWPFSDHLPIAMEVLIPAGVRLPA